MSFSTAFGNKFNRDTLRIRTFDFNGHTFKVKVPLTAESDAMFERLKTPDDALVDKYYAELSKDFTEASDSVQITENDVLIDGRSIRDTAQTKALIQARITEMFKMLVPEDTSFDMSTIDYSMIDEQFPFAIQMQMMELIGETVSPTYTNTKGK